MTRWSSTADSVTYGKNILDGKHIRLRARTEADLPVLANWYENPEIAVLQQMIVRPVPESGSVERFRNWTANESLEAVGFCVARKSDGALLGQAGLIGIDLRNRSAELIIMLGPEFHGKGYGSDTVRTLVRWGFAELDLHRVELWVFSFNTGAIGAYRRAGFTEEGRKREAFVHDGHRYDAVLMGVLRSEWSPRP
ncbi:GNAT family N-acetyltransferase [Sciscionella marina]|uniref:GNAT family N-acetyltransferase n=1 Tax=Sciscionella marina TaxID=508770 RepID=UPI0003814182|nr:GNAT family protein [Sciscionella marina]